MNLNIKNWTLNHNLISFSNKTLQIVIWTNMFSCKWQNNIFAEEMAKVPSTQFIWFNDSIDTEWETDGDSCTMQGAKFPKFPMRSLEAGRGWHDCVRVCEVTNDVLLNMEPKHTQGDNLLACTSPPSAHH